MLADRYPNYSICGLPYFLSGEVPDWRSLAHRTVDDLERTGIELLLEHTAQRIDSIARDVTVRTATGEHRERYDALIIATGAEPVRPPVPGIDLEGVFQLHTIGDSLALDAALAGGPGSAVIVGAGYIGLEMAEALRTRGLAVTVIERLPTVLSTLDAELGALVRDELERNGVRVLTDTSMTAIEQQGRRLGVVAEPDLTIEADVVLVVVGVRPDTRLGRDLGVPIGAGGAVEVDRCMQTNFPYVFAAGDCAVTYHRLLGANSYLPLGTTAHKQGRIAGENAIGGDRPFEGSLGTQVVKIFDLAAARTGLRDHEASAAGFEPVTVASHGFDHKAYYPGAHDVAVRITGDRGTGRLLGAQLLGHVDAQVPKRIDIIATAMHDAMSVETLSDLDLSYTPPFGSPWDIVQTAAQDWMRARRGRPAIARPA
jgi:NADPH-dependent 2,4-dienoyl-CoA reductase/sulfur reductase-like enzyme